VNNQNNINPMRKLIVLHTDQNAYAAEIVATALARSFTNAQVAKLNYDELGDLPDAAVLIEPNDRRRQLVDRMIGGRRKTLILGKPGPAVAERVGLAVRDDLGLPADGPGDAATVATPRRTRSGGHRRSRPSACSPFHIRPFTFDFADSGTTSASAASTTWAMVDWRSHHNGGRRSRVTTPARGTFHICRPPRNADGRHCGSPAGRPGGQPGWRIVGVL
jgi:hypothetical protein